MRVNYMSVCLPDMSRCELSRGMKSPTTKDLGRPVAIAFEPTLCDADDAGEIGNTQVPFRNAFCVEVVTL